MIKTKSLNGGIGRHKGLKIPRLKNHVSSTLTSGTIKTKGYKMKRVMSYHLIKNTTKTKIISLCGLSIDKRAIGKERLVTSNATEVTCPICTRKLADKNQ